MSPALSVWFGTVLIGRLFPQESGQMGFSYADEWLRNTTRFEVSASLPLKPGLLPASPFFAGLLPEGAVREALAHQLGLSADNDFALLEALGGDCAGALSLSPVGSSPEPATAHYEPLELDALINQAESSSLFAAKVVERATRLSLAGAQDKLPVAVDNDGNLALPMGGAPSTHIVKVASKSFKELPFNEVLSLRLAKAVGLRVANARLLKGQRGQVALIERYDRRKSEGEIVRLHQEDFCQALGHPRSRKYEQEGGPSLVDAVALVRARSREPLSDVQRLLDWQLFNLLAGNSDGHGKNLSLLHTESGIVLSPHYDLVCTRVYRTLDRNIAMSIGGARDPGQIGAQHWEAFAKQLSVGHRLVVKRVEDLSEQIPEVFEQVAADLIEEVGDASIVNRMRMAITKQCRRTRTLLK